MIWSETGTHFKFMLNVLTAGLWTKKTIVLFSKAMKTYIEPSWISSNESDDMKQQQTLSTK